MMKSLLDQKYIKSQVDSCLSCDELLKNSITYDLLVVRKFMQADVTYNALISGMSQVSEVFELESKQIFDHYLTHPELLRVYGLGFASSHVFSDMEFVSKLSFSGPERILDLGGGCANLGNIILSTQDTVYYTNYDLPGVADAFSSEINQLKENFQNRFQLIEGDMFHQEENLQGIQNEKYDKIFLGWILHDWSDEQCLKILKKCRGHLAPEGEIIIFEILPIEGNHFSFIDWLIFVMANGYERNFEAYKRLAEKACMEIESVYSTKSNRSMIKVRKIK
jgi:phospholipid N-methyltransferase